MEMRRIDSLLAERLNALNEQNDALKRAEFMFLELDASKKALLAQLTIKGRGVKALQSVRAEALASNDWKIFGAYVQAETEFNYEKRAFAKLS